MQRERPARSSAPLCRDVVRDAERRAAATGHENHGFLSWSNGFIPRIPPRHALGPAFAAWDQLAAELPQLYRDLSLRRRVKALPVLDASEEALDDRELLRACALMGIVAQAYWNVEVRPPEGLPAPIVKPWAQLRRRLGRSQEVLSYIDLIVYNWRVIDPAHPEPLRLENLRLLLPTVDNREEQVFYLTQVEILARSAPVVGCVAAAQDAVIANDEDGLEKALLGIAACLKDIVYTSLPKINPNRLGQSFVDPVVWAKTVAPFAVPMRAGDQGPSGTSSPIFNTLDLFFGRKDYASFLGREIRQLRGTYPASWRAFLEALARVPIGAFVERSGNESLRSAWRDALELYVGQDGFLGRHRMKVYGFLELAFKVGRSLTIGGFGGVFKDRTWDQIDNELEAARDERARLETPGCREARIQRRAQGPVEPGAVRHLTLDLSRAGVRFGAGDRCAIYPENGPELVERTLRALDAAGDELVRLTDEWKALARVRRQLTGVTALPVREVLRYGAIRPVSARLAEALHARTQSRTLLDHIRRGCTERWELWELLELLRAEGHAPRRLWHDGEARGASPADDAGEGLCRLIPPERSRLYSIASAPRSPLDKPAQSLNLLVGHLAYRAASEAAPPGTSDRVLQRPEAPASTPADAAATSSAPAPRAPAALGCPMHDPSRFDPGGRREGTASSFLARAAREHTTIPFQLEHPARFQPPRDPRTPIVFFAGGTGVSPFLSFLDERERMRGAGPCWLLWSLRSREDFVCRAELEPALRAGLLELDTCFTREPATVHVAANSAIEFEPGQSRRIDELMLDPGTAERLWARLTDSDGPGAALYVCGRSGFARSVLAALRTLFERHAQGSEAERRAQAAAMLSRLVANDRLFFEIHTDAQPASEAPRWLEVSEIAEHNDAGAGYWMIVDRVVYDVTDFADLHPGGRRIVDAYAGIDATHGYARAHHQRPEVDAMRDMYRIGMVRALDFDDYTTEVLGPSGPVTVSCRTAHHAWVNALHLCVEMQNALRMDYGLQGCAIVAGEGPAERGAYKLSRALETHSRFLESYQKVLATDTLPGLWRISQGLFARDMSPDWMQLELTRVASDSAQHGERVTRALHAELVAVDADLARAREVAELSCDADLGFLADLKRALARGVRAFERHERRTRSCGAGEIRAACLELAAVFERSAERLARELALRSPESGQRMTPPLPLGNPGFGACAPVATEPAAGITRRLYTSPHWILEEHSAERLAVLQRTPVAWGSLEELRAENAAILRSLRADQRQAGLLVDMRHAPIRNDTDFENAMAALRAGLTGHFKRTAVLLESRLGELQVTRIERDERRTTLATRSESAALKFLSGGK